MCLFNNRIDDVGDTQWQGEILDHQVVGVLQLDITDTEIVGIPVILALIECGANSQAQLMTAQKIVMST